VAELQALAGGFGDDYLRVYLREPTRAGLRDETMAVLPNALEVRIDPEFADQGSTKRQGSGEDRTTRTPAQLFGDFCATRNVSDPRVAALFGELHDDVTSADSADLSAAG